MEPIDVDSLRRRAREQREQRALSARTRWVVEFESALRQILSPRVELFVSIMGAVGNPGLDERHDGGSAEAPRAWLLAAFESMTLLSAYEGTEFPVTYPVFLTLSPVGPSFHTSMALPVWQSVAVSESAPVRMRTVVTLGEIETPSALGRVGVSRYADDPARVDARDEAQRFADLCTRRMMLLLWAHELTFPDLDAAEVTWDDDETAIILAAEKTRRRARVEVMTTAQFAQWVDAALESDGLALPSLTGSELADALSRTTYEPRRRFRRNWRNRLVDDGEKGWQISEDYLERSETRLRIASVDGTGFREATGESVEEFGPEHVYLPGLYRGYLDRRRFYHERGDTF